MLRISIPSDILCEMLFEIGNFTSSCARKQMKHSVCLHCILNFSVTSDKEGIKHLILF